MNLKQRTKEELESKIHELEDFISKKGVGSGYLAKAERAQRNLNISLFFGMTLTVAGLFFWLFAGKRTN